MIGICFLTNLKLFWAPLIYDDVPKLKATKFENDVVLEFNYYVPQTDLNDPSPSIYQVDKDINIKDIGQLKEKWERQPDVDIKEKLLDIHQQKPYKKRKPKSDS